MIKNGYMFVVGLLVLSFAAASTLSHLNGAAWSGEVNSMIAARVGRIPPNAFSNNFKREGVDLRLGVKTVRGSPRSCGPSPPPCRSGPPSGPNEVSSSYEEL